MGRESLMWAHVWMALYRPRTVWGVRIRIHAPLRAAHLDQQGATDGQ